VRESDDVDIVLPNAVNQSVGEAGNQPRPGSFLRYSNGWTCSNQLAGSGNRVEKLAAKARPLQFVPANRLGELS
jgi:hypothetical protein